jgi:predicted RNase H-like HicB family nuclease
MVINLSATIYKTGNIYTGWLDDIKGVISQGSSIEEVKDNLLKLLQIKKEVENRRSAAHVCNNNLFHEELPLQIPA